MGAFCIVVEGLNVVHTTNIEVILKTKITLINTSSKHTSVHLLCAIEHTSM